MPELADLGRTIIGLGAVLVLMAAVFWLLRRFGPQGGVPRGAARRLVLVESLPLDPRTRLVLVRHDGREHLLMVSASGGLAVLPSADAAMPGGSAA